MLGFTRLSAQRQITLPLTPRVWPDGGVDDLRDEWR